MSRTVSNIQISESLEPPIIALFYGQPENTILVEAEQNIIIQKKGNIKKILPFPIL